jgi:hypothetical protein
MEVATLYCWLESLIRRGHFFLMPKDVAEFEAEANPEDWRIADESEVTGASPSPKKELH